MTEKEANELIALIVEKKCRLTKDDFLRESQLSKTKAAGLTKQFEFYKVDSDVAIKMESQTEPVEKPIEVEEQVLRHSEGKHAKAKAQAKDLKMDIVLEKIRLVLEDYFREDLENVEKLCKENHDMQTKSIERQSQSLKKVEEKINEVSKSAESLKKDASGLVKASAQQAAKEIDIKKEAYQQLFLSSQLHRMEHSQPKTEDISEVDADVDQRVKVDKRPLQVDDKQRSDCNINKLDGGRGEQEIDEFIDEISGQRPQFGYTKEMEYSTKTSGGVRGMDNSVGNQVLGLKPTLPCFDGLSSWETFLNTVEINSEASGWDEHEQFNALQMCMRDNEDIGCWADRVLREGMDAFEKWSNEDREEQLVRQFSMGCMDKGAAHFVINCRPEISQDAFSLMKLHQENAVPLFGRKADRAYEKDVLEVEEESE